MSYREAMVLVSLVGYLWGWGLGLLMGQWMEARRWRGKADSDTRMCSGGRLYNVEQDE